MEIKAAAEVRKNVNTAYFNKYSHRIPKKGRDKFYIEF